jgi:hypothetical protein
MYNSMMSNYILGFGLKGQHYTAMGEAHWSKNTIKFRPERLAL